MKYLMRMKNESGFSLVELMVSVGIIGAMSSVAIPRYQKFRANAAQAEAQASLSSIYTLQQLHFTENGEYVGVGSPNTELASKLKYAIPTNARYKYETQAFKSDDSAAVASDKDKTKFKATAKSGTPLASCSAGEEDIWCVNQDKEMRNNASADYLPCDKDDDNNEGGC